MSARPTFEDFYAAVKVLQRTCEAKRAKGDPMRYAFSSCPGESSGLLYVADTAEDVELLREVRELEWRLREAFRGGSAEPRPVVVEARDVELVAALRAFLERPWPRRGSSE